MYSQKRKLHSQNFLRSPELVKKLIRNSSIGKSDTVLEIGPGKGIITSELLKVSGKVVAVELDSQFYGFLKEKYRNSDSLELYQGNFLKLKLPQYPYKVFANIPFVITSDVIRKLSNDKNFLEGYLIVQKEAAKRFMGKPYDCRNQMMSVLHKPWFDTSVFYKFSRNDFTPRPKVDTVMIRIKSVEKPPVPWSDIIVYRNYIMHLFNREKVSGVGFEVILKRFQYFLKYSSDSDKSRIQEEGRKIFEAQKKIIKINRTRTDRNWRKF